MSRSIDFFDCTAVPTKISTFSDGIGQLSSTRRETGRGGRAGKTIGTPVPGSGWTRDGGDRVASLEKFAATAFNAARGDGRPAACPLPLANGIELPNDLTRAKTTQPVPEPCGE